MRFGGQFTYIQLNVGYGAYQQAIEALGDLPGRNEQPGGRGRPMRAAPASPILSFQARVNPGNIARAIQISMAM